MGPIGFMIRDRPVDIPAQWYHCYRFFWLGIYSESVAFTVGIIAIVLIVIYNLFSKYKGKMCLYTADIAEMLQGITPLNMA